MRTLGRTVPAIQLKAITALALCFGLLIIAACGGGSANVEETDIDKTIASDGWEVTLIEVPQKETLVGEGGFTSQATGNYVILIFRVTNQNPDILLFPPALLQVEDGQGSQFKPTGSTVQFNHARTLEGVNLLLDSPLKENETRDVALIYDVPSDAQDLSLVMEGATESIRLGF